MLSKRCNFDCSYCSPHAHDAVSPFVDLNKSLGFIHRLDDWALDQQKKIKWAFTGGEPFLDPGFFQIIKTLNRLDSTEQTNVVTNGSLPFDVYANYAEFLRGITFSIHLERTQSEVQALIEKVIRMHKLETTFVSTNLMPLPGRLSQIMEIKSILDQAKVPCSVRRIAPMTISQEYMPFEITGKGRKSAKLLNIEVQSQTKNQWKKINDSTYKTELEKYYNNEEDAYLEEVGRGPLWQNMGAWTDSGYHEMNSNYLIANKTNTFLGWTCFAGIDHVMIDFDGRVYRAVCLNDGPIGHIEDGVGFVEMPTVCQRQWCICNSDVAIRKATDKSLHLISKPPDSEH